MLKPAHTMSRSSAGSNVIPLPLPAVATVATIRAPAMLLVGAVSLACWAAAGHALGLY